MTFLSSCRIRHSQLAGTKSNSEAEKAVATIKHLLNKEKDPYLTLWNIDLHHLLIELALQNC